MNVSKKKETRDLQPWIRSTINHFWWCCASCQKDETELKEKWLSILFHITNQHSWSGCTKYEKCAHTKLTDAEQRVKKWSKPGSQAF